MSSHIFDDQQCLRSYVSLITETLELESQEGFTKMLKDQYPQMKRVFNAYDLNLFAVHLHDQVQK